MYNFNVPPRIDINQLYRKYNMKKPKKTKKFKDCKDLKEDTNEHILGKLKCFYIKRQWAGYWELSRKLTNDSDKASNFAMFVANFARNFNVHNFSQY